MYGWKDRYMDERMRVYGWELDIWLKEWMNELRAGYMDKGIKRQREEEGSEKEVWKDEWKWQINKQIPSIFLNLFPYLHSHTPT
jgi:hypothetical protein